jgi:3-oxo-5-alpha-steroid 4-dehydrogenase 3
MVDNLLAIVSLDLLLSAYWVAMGLSVFAAMFIPALRSFTDHGKLSGGRKLPLTVPKHYFSHFYILGSVLNLVMLLRFVMELGLEGLSQQRLESVAVHVLMQLQMARRLYETLYVNNTKGGTMHILAYAFSFSFYIAAILSLSVAPSGSEPVVLSWRHALGGMLFPFGSLHQHSCHKILAGLRKGGTKQPGEKAQYFVPKGDWFELVTCPHYFAEILIYMGLFAIRGVNAGYAVALLFAFVCINLSFTAWHAHAWYLTKFNDYPKNRKVIVPYIF